MVSMMNSGHTPAAQLALLASGDLDFWSRRRARRHAVTCDECAAAAREFARLQLDVAQAAAEEIPARLSGAAWQSLASEMTANIRLGLVAGACVSAARFTPRRSRIRFAMAAVALLLLLIGAEQWVVEKRFAQKRGVRAAVSVASKPVENLASAEPMVEASGGSVAMRAPGREFAFISPAGLDVTRSLSPGGIRSRYMDETGVTIVNVDAE